MAKESQVEIQCVETGEKVLELYRNRLVSKNSKEGAMEKILCVDGDQSILELYKEELSEDGYEVILAANGKEALIKYQMELPQLVILEMHMPGMDGIEALSTILGMDRQASIIINTAFPQYQGNFMTWGAEAYIIKSSDLGELKQKMREVLNKRQAAKATLRIDSGTLVNSVLPN